MQFRRRREKKTDYVQRLALLKSGKHRLVVRRSGNNFRMQIVDFTPEGDKTLVEVASSMLRKYGWKGHCGSVPAAYLTGLLMGKEASNKGIREAVPDLGMQMSVRGSSLFACVLGARDGGIKISIGKEALPAKDRIEGKHIAEYASMLKGKDDKKYSRHFSAYLKNGLEPEKLPEHFNEVKENIGIAVKEKVEA